jgi:hypothetical protein
MTIDVDKDLRARFGAARDQDPRPTCMAFAASDAHAAARGVWRPLSVEWAYFHALKQDKTVPHAGATMRGMLAALKSEGQPEEEAWPYIQELFADTLAWVPPNASPIFRRDNVIRAGTVDAIFASLDADLPVVFTMSISKSFRRPGSGGVIHAIEPLEPRRVHALVGVGYGHQDQDKFLLIRNSWGEAWGVDGYAWVSVAYLTPRLLRVATMAGEL